MQPRDREREREKSIHNNKPSDGKKAPRNSIDNQNVCVYIKIVNIRL